LTSHDQLAKDLFQTFFGDLLRLAAPAAAKRLRLESTRFVDKQAFTDWPAGVRREMDLLAEASARTGDLRILIHVEIEAKASATMAERLWKYYMQLRLRHGLLVLPILVNLRGGKPGLRKALWDEGFEARTARFRYRSFSPAGCQAEDYLALAYPLAWALAALMRRGRWSRAEQKMACLRRIATAKFDPDRSWLLRNWVETYLQLTGRDALEYERLLDLAVNREVRIMKMTWAERMEAEYTQKGIEKGMEKGIEAGMAKGIQAGLEKGKIEALRGVVLRLLGQRFGQVPETVRRRVESLDATEPLEALAGKVLEVHSIEEMGLS
jgi:hypothetical protein